MSVVALVSWGEFFRGARPPISTEYLVEIETEDPTPLPHVIVRPGTPGPTLVAFPDEHGIAALAVESLADLTLGDLRLATGRYVNAFTIRSMDKATVHVVGEA